MKLYGKEYSFTIKHYGESEPKEIVRYGFVDAKNNWTIKPHYFLVSEFSEGLALVTLNEPSRERLTPMAFIDIYNLKVVEFNTPEAPENLQNISQIKDFKNGFSLIRQGKLDENNNIIHGNYALINKKGKLVTDFEFEKPENAVIKNADILAQEITLDGPECLNWAENSLFTDYFTEEKLNIALKEYIRNLGYENITSAAANKKAKQSSRVYEQIKADKIRELRIQRNNRPDFTDEYIR